jgi:Putative Flp pilus-assembly TadE/G-like
MKKNAPILSFVKRALKDESGQMLPWIAMLSVLFLGMTGLTLDLGRAFTCYRELQTSTDAATLAGAYAMSLTGATTSSVTTAVTNYSSATGGKNVNSNLPGATVSVTLKCLTTVANAGILCGATPAGNFNALEVVQTASVPTIFIRVLSLFGVNSASSLTLRTAATASMRGAANAQYNVAMVVDTTSSMGSNDTDGSCGNTRIHCALGGIQTLLSHLTPCTVSSTTTSCTAFDQVSLFTFPAVQANTAQNDIQCPTSNPKISDYFTPTAGGTWTNTNFSSTNPTYQLTTYLSDYSSTNKTGAPLNTSSALTIAADGNTTKNCDGLQTPGGKGTYFAGAIYSALSSLAAAQAANPGSKNALIILSDGDADSSNITNGKNSGNTYGSLQDQCAQAVTAAQSAASMTDTTVYTIAYGAASSGCASDDYNAKTNPSGSNITPCQTMQQMATNASTFYSDATASQNKGQCTSPANPSLSLAGIFTQVATQFTIPRLIPDSSQ